MKLIYLIGLILISTSSIAVDLQIKQFAFAPFGNDHALIIGSGTLTQQDSIEQSTLFAPHSIKGASDTAGYFTEFQFVIGQNLLLTGNWTRINQSNTHNHGGHRILKAAKWSLTNDPIALTAKTLGINWHINEGWGAYAKLQTVSGSAWLPQHSIPSYITQDLENWTLGSVGVVYQF